MGRARKYSTPEERKAAQKAQQKAYEERNKEARRAYRRENYQYVKPRNEYMKEWRENNKNVTLAAKASPWFREQVKLLNDKLAEMAKRIEAVEKENKEILLDLEEVLEDNKKVKNLVKWGKK